MNQRSRSWKDILVSPVATIAEAVEVISKGRFHICLVVDDNQKLVGTVADGDVRRAILSSTNLKGPIKSIMFTTPMTVAPGATRDAVLIEMRSREIREIPIITSDGTIVGLHTLEELTDIWPKDNWVVIMAGGEGRRLRPHTEDTPKPMLKVGTKPILETILESFVGHGFSNFYISVNYKADIIKNHFGDGSRWNVNIRYLEEKSKLGMAGALGLFSEKPKSPVLVINGDVLTKLDVPALLDYHLQQGVCATMGVREYDIQVPFGVVDIKDQKIRKIDEKPVQSFFINAGIYVINPEMLDYIPKNGAIDMTDLFNLALSDEAPLGVFPIQEYWLDIGRIEDFNRANTDFPLTKANEET